MILCCVCGGLVFFVFFVPWCERINSSHNGTADTKVFFVQAKALCGSGFNVGEKLRDMFHFGETDDHIVYGTEVHHELR